MLHPFLLSLKEHFYFRDESAIHRHTKGKCSIMHMRVHFLAAKATIEQRSEPRIVTQLSVIAYWSKPEREGGEKRKKNVNTSQNQGINNYFLCNPYSLGVENWAHILTVFNSVKKDLTSIFSIFFLSFLLVIFETSSLCGFLSPIT